MIVDTFLFNDEFEMLDVRLGITEQYVDKWIILEGNKTWSGQEKPYILKNNFKKVSKYADRIDLITLDIPDDLTLQHRHKHWYIENYSRASLQMGIDKLDKDDIVIHSDLDEIINPEVFPAVLDTLNKENKPVSCTIDLFFYAFNLQAYRSWQGNIVAKKHMFSDPHQLYRGDQHKKKDRRHCVYHPGIAGYHWTWIGNDHRIQNKASSCIETAHRDSKQILNDLINLDTQTAINHKCKTRKVDYDYPQSVLKVINQSPYWV